MTHQTLTMPSLMNFKPPASSTCIQNSLRTDNAAIVNRRSLNTDLSFI